MRARLFYIGLLLLVVAVLGGAILLFGDAPPPPKPPTPFVWWTHDLVNDEDVLILCDVSPDLVAGGRGCIILPVRTVSK